MRVTDEGYSRKASCAVNFIATLLSMDIHDIRSAFYTTYFNNLFTESLAIKEYYSVLNISSYNTI